MSKNTSDQPVSTASGQTDSFNEGEARDYARENFSSNAHSMVNAFVMGARWKHRRRDEEVAKLKEANFKLSQELRSGWPISGLEENRRLREALEAARPWLKMALDSDYFEGHGNLKRAICLVNEALALKDSGR